jgi:acetyl-CoA C-acetyltransferase
MSDAVIVSTARTGIGKAFRGALNQTHGATMAGHAIQHAVARAKIDPGEVEDVILGCGLPEGATGHNVGRNAAIRAGLPVSVSGTTVNRFCSSGLQAISMAAQRVLVDRVPIMVAGGVESISLTQATLNANHITEDWLMKHKPELWMPMINTADIVAERYKVSRELQDEYALASQQRTAAAQEGASSTTRSSPSPPPCSRRTRRRARPGKKRSPSTATRATVRAPPSKRSPGCNPSRAAPSPPATRASCPTAPPPAW